MLIQPLVLLLGQPHEAAMLWSRDALNIGRIMETFEVFVRLANAVVLRTVAVLDIGDTPTLLANDLEGTATFTFLGAFETHKVVLIRFRPWSCEFV